MNKKKIELPVLLAFVYILIPFLCFLGYHHPALLLIPGAIGLIWGNKNIKKYKISVNSIPKSIFILCFLIAIIIALLTGNLSFIWGIEQGDWFKHNTILNDLVMLDWPVRYDIGYSLNYYFGIYLVPALIGKIFDSYFIAKIALGLWTVLGLFIGLLNIFILFFNKDNKNKNAFIAVIILIFIFSGIDVLRPIIKYNVLPYPGEHIEWSQTVHIYPNVDRGDGTLVNIATLEGDPLQYPAIVTSLAWAPQHFMPLFIILPILFRKKFKVTLLLTAMSLIWSPFAILGIGFITIIQLLLNIDRQKPIINKGNLFYLMLLALIALPQIYFYSRHVDVAFPVMPIASFENWYMFILSELSPILFIFVLLFKFLNKQERIASISLIIMLLILPMFRYGWQVVSDLTLRTSTPLIFSLLLIFIGCLLRIKEKLRIFMIALFFFIGIITPFNEIYRIGQGSLMLPHSDNIASPGDINLKQQYFLQYLGK